jgi:hypothetical protein
MARSTAPGAGCTYMSEGYGAGCGRRRLGRPGSGVVVVAGSMPAVSLRAAFRANRTLQQKSLEPNTLATRTEPLGMPASPRCVSLRMPSITPHFGSGAFGSGLPSMEIMGPASWEQPLQQRRRSPWLRRRRRHQARLLCFGGYQARLVFILISARVWMTASPSVAMADFVAEDDVIWPRSFLNESVVADNDDASLPFVEANGACQCRR